jgi:hypothetical protein
MSKKGKKDKEKKNPVGAPRVWDYQKLAADIIEYVDAKKSKDLKQADIPWIEDFCMYYPPKDGHRLLAKTLWEAAKDSDKLRNALSLLKQAQMMTLTYQGGKGRFDQRMAKLFLAANHDVIEKTSTQIEADIKTSSKVDYSRLTDSEIETLLAIQAKASMDEPAT